MREALHPAYNRTITYSEYLEYALSQNCTRPNDALGARCPVCDERLKVRAGHRRDDGHFYHSNNSSCPTINPASQPYGHLPPTSIDPEAVASNREFAKNNLGKIYKRLKDMIPYMDFKEFISILEEAKKLNVYGYANLQPELLPYVYVTLINYLPSKSYGKKRQLKFCFFYDAAITSYEELWINLGEFSSLTRISYQNNQSNRMTQMDVDIEYLNEEVNILSEKQLKWCFNCI